MMKTAIWPLAALALLAGCGSKQEVSLKNASVEEAANAADALTQLTPGQWDSVIKIVSVDMPGLGGANSVAGQALTKRMIGQEQKSSQCITPDQAAKPPVEMLAGGGAGANCRFDTFDMKGGTLSMQLQCGKKGNPGAMIMTSAGPFSGDSYALDTQMTMNSPAGEMKIMATNSAKRVGPCTAAKGS
jgi:Protein of unknown function (DUF3617)